MSNLGSTPILLPTTTTRIACARPASRYVMFDRTHANKCIVVSNKLQYIDIVLNSSSDGGYEWSAHVDTHDHDHPNDFKYDPAFALVKVTHDTSICPLRLIGCSGDERLQLEATREFNVDETIRIICTQQRRWEKDVAPVETLIYYLRIVNAGGTDIEIIKPHWW